MTRPFIYGFTVDWDALNEVWVATSASGTYRVTGRSQSELEANRHALYAHVLADFRAAIAEVYPLPPGQ